MAMVYPVGYNQKMGYTLASTTTFRNWVEKLDPGIRRRLLARIDRVCLGNFGDHKQLQPGLYEMRFFFGSGYRVYYTLRDGRIVLLLAGGDKSSQARDIAKAKTILDSLE